MVKQYKYMIFHLYLQIITNRSIFQKVRSSRKIAKLRWDIQVTEYTMWTISLIERHLQSKKIPRIKPRKAKPHIKSAISKKLKNVCNNSSQGWCWLPLRLAWWKMLSRIPTLTVQPRRIVSKYTKWRIV